MLFVKHIKHGAQFGKKISRERRVRRSVCRRAAVLAEAQPPPHKRVITSMHIIASMFETRPRAEEAIERLVAARCPRDAITFLPEEELAEIADGGFYDWRKDRWGLWRGLAMFETMSETDRYSLAEGMNRGRSVLLVAARGENDAEQYSTVLVEAGAVDLDDLEKEWREKGWSGFDGPSGSAGVGHLRSPTRSPKVRLY